jgi:hypothetical protein
MTYVGHTEDGNVFLTFETEYSGQPIRTTVELSIPQAKELIKMIESATESAKGIMNVGNSPHVN